MDELRFATRSFNILITHFAQTGSWNSRFLHISLWHNATFFAFFVSFIQIELLSSSFRCLQRLLHTVYPKVVPIQYATDFLEISWCFLGMKGTIQPHLVLKNTDSSKVSDPNSDCIETILVDLFIRESLPFHITICIDSLMKLLKLFKHTDWLAEKNRVLQ